jgi:AcrR family transcriptional regulator
MVSPLPPPPTTRKARSTYNGIIEATRSVVRATGRVSPEEIAVAAAISPATFYTYFSSKDSALAAAFDATLSDIAASLQPTLSIELLLDRGLEHAIAKLVTGVVDGFNTDARIFRLAISRLPESNLVRAVYRHHERTYLAALGRFIRLGQAAGRILDADAEHLAEVTLMTLQGLQNPLTLRHDPARISISVATMLTWLLTPDE